MLVALVVISLAVSALAKTCDALCNRTRSELRVFTEWLRDNDVSGYIGEVGWPDDHAGDAEEWNEVAHAWFADANAAGLDVTTWATGSLWGTTYPLAAYEDRSAPEGVDSSNTQAAVIAAHPSSASYLRGINVAGGEFGAPSVAPESSFSNANLGTHDQQYAYDPAPTYRFLSARGARIVRIPFRWERIQPALGSPLDQTALAQLRGAVSSARDAGLRVVLDMHNYGLYYLSDGTRGVRRAVGSDEVPKARFADVWRRLSRVFGRDDSVYAYGLMNEPVGIAPKGDLSPAQRWEILSQAALNAIRRNGDRKLVMVPGYNWSGVQEWSRVHPKSWIRDPAKRFRYEAHHYWDADHSGRYTSSYATELSRARAAGY